MNLRNISFIIYRTAGEIRKHLSKLKPFVLLRVQGITDKIKHFVRLVDSGPLHCSCGTCVIYNTVCNETKTFL